MMVGQLSHREAAAHFPGARYGLARSLDSTRIIQEGRTFSWLLFHPTVLPSLALGGA
jgi:hypothetical protein